MSGSQAYPPPGPPSGGPPPPGWTPPPEPRPTWSPAPGPPPPYAGMLGAAHKPGALPLRPLGLGDIYDAAFKVIRFNPRATVGSAVLVAAVAMTIPVLVTAVLTFGLDLSSDTFGEDSTDLIGIGFVYLTAAVGSVLQYIGLIFVTGMIA